MLTGAVHETETLDGRTFSVLPTPLKEVKRRKPQLTTVEGVRVELARIYREAEEGKRDVAEASKLTYMLGEIRKTLEVAEIETRLGALEARTNGKQLPAPR